MAGNREVKLRDLTEAQLLKMLLAGVPRGRNVRIGPGDDCAAIAITGSRELLLLKTDCVVEGVHYVPAEDPARVGWKALCRAISDIAAMGGTPRHALITVFSPGDRPAAYWKTFYRGLSRAGRRFGVGIVGGETSRSPAAAVAVTLTGTVLASRILRRSGGRPGDGIFVTGKLGGSLRGKHLDFVPRLAEGQWLGASGLASAMMDLSDGLSADLPRLAEASGCGFAIDPALVPRNRGCTAQAALADGEDFELLFTVPPRNETFFLRKWRRRFPRVPVTAIGHLTRPGEPAAALPAGFDHFFHCQPGQERAS